VQNTQSGANGNIAATGATQSGTRAYWTDFSTNVHCFDYSSNTNCGTIKAFPGYANPGGAAENNAWGSRTEAFGHSVFINWIKNESTDAAGIQRFVSCIDTTTNALCPGYPSSAISHRNDAFVILNTDMTPVLDATGTVKGICVSNITTIGTQDFACVNLAGAPIANPYPPSLGTGDIGQSGFGDGVVVGAKVYLPFYLESAGTTQYVCFNFATNTPCAGFVNTPQPGSVHPYTLRQDPFAPACLWEVGDVGIIQVISKNTGASCADSEADSAINPAAYYCDGGSHPTAWTSISLEGVTSADYTSAQVTVLDKNGSIVPGFDAITVPNTRQTIDISAIPPTGNTSALNVSVTMTGLRTGITPTPTLAVAFSGDPVQVCFQTKVPNACPAAGATISNAATAVTVGESDASDAPAGNPSGSATFAVVASKATCELTVSKIASVHVAAPGETVAYEIKITNSGTADYTVGNPASFTDDLSHVLPDATFSGHATASTGTVTFASPTLSWSGALAAGASATIRYSVAVKSPDSGPGHLVNTVVSIPPSNCAAGSKDPSCTADVPVIILTVAKKLERVNGQAYSGGAVMAGDTLTYAITLTNSSASSGSSTLTETVGAHLTYAGTAEGWSPGCSTPGTTCTQTLTAAAHSHATATFTEKVSSQLPPGTTELTNTVSTAATCAPCTVHTPATPPGVGPTQLPHTGASVATVVGSAALLMTIGMLLTLRGRRRRLGVGDLPRI
jgi:uncharacterized repeat protein (TIGR01451 family)